MGKIFTAFLTIFFSSYDKYTDFVFVFAVVLRSVRI